MKAAARPIPLIGRIIFAVLLAGQSGAWLFWPPDVEFPYGAAVPLLALTVAGIAACWWTWRRGRRRAAALCPRPLRSRWQVRWLAGGIGFAALGTLIGALWMRARILPVARATHQRPYTQLAEVPQPLLDCILASEDRHFYQHSGVDWPALHRAIRMDVQAGQFIRGGSTLTMQGTRCAFLTRRRTVWRKLCEVPLALFVDRLMTKDEVLTLYLNTARFGLGPDGIRAASERYFGKPPRGLTLAESAFLAGALPRAPKSTAEVTPEFVRLCRERTLRLLGSYLPSRYGPEELRQAATVPLVFAWERNRGEKPTR